MTDRDDRRALLAAAFEMLGESGGGTLRVRGDSMLPTLRPGQLVAVDPAPGALSRGDVILFLQAGSLLVHRLLGPARAVGGTPRLRTRGDGAAVLDPALDPADVVGRVVALEDAGAWRSTLSPGARRYGRWLARHALGWAALRLAARTADRALAALRLPAFLGSLAGAADRALARLVHRALFERCHAVIPRPPQARGEAAADRLL
jgi:hypothetical protein